MKGQAFSFIYVLNIIVQAIFTLAFSILIFVGIGYAAVELIGGPSWIYVITILIGVLTGLISMVRFILSAMQGLDRLEAERSKRNTKRGSDEK